MGESQRTFSDMVSELGLAAAMRPKTEYTILAPVNAAFTRELISRQVLWSTRGSHILSFTDDSFITVYYEVMCHQDWDLTLVKLFKICFSVFVRGSQVERPNSTTKHFGKPHLEAENHS